MTKKWNGSSVMTEFEKVAAETGLITTDLNPDKKDFVGNPSKSPVGPFGDNGISMTDKERKDDGLYNVTKEEGKDIIEKAHPKTVEIASAMGAGGVVENQIEQQEKNIDIATKMPSGALFGIHAELVKELVNKANKFEEEGKVKEALRIDETIRRIASLPFPDGRLTKTAWIGAIIGLVSMVAPIAYNYLKGGQTTTTKQKGKTYTTTKGRTPMGRWGKGAAVLGGAMTLLSAFGNKITSRKEDLKTDLQDLYDILQAAKSKGSKSAGDAANLLKPFLGKLTRPLDEKNFKKFAKIFENLETIRPKLQSLMARVKIELGEGRWYHFGFDIVSRLEEKYNDFVDVMEETKSLLKSAYGLGQKMDYVAKRSMEEPDIKPEDKVRKLQEILGVDITGEMNRETIAAAAKLEENIDQALAKIGIENTKSFKQRVVRGDKIVIDPDKLEKILSLISQAIKKKEKTMV
jgi:hypothetical protein